MSNLLRYTKALEEMKEELLSEIDGGEECLGNDQKLSGWIEIVDEAICDITLFYRGYHDLVDINARKKQ